MKDGGDRMRAKCTWKSYQWVCLLMKTSKFETWQIASFMDERTCSRRKDDKLVTSKALIEMNQLLGLPLKKI